MTDVGIKTICDTILSLGGGLAMLVVFLALCGVFERNE